VRVRALDTLCLKIKLNLVNVQDLPSSIVGSLLNLLNDDSSKVLPILKDLSAVLVFNEDKIRM
jgi:hypothetical protein